VLRYCRSFPFVKEARSRNDRQIFHASLPGFPCKGHDFVDRDGVSSFACFQSSKIKVPSALLMSERRSPCRNNRHQLISICSF
jgi:hypothetical protein